MKPFSFFAKRGFFAKPDYLDESECLSLCQELRIKDQTPATIENETYSGIDLTVRRTSQVKPLRETRNRFQAYFQDLMPDLVEHFQINLNFCEGPQFLRYQAGDFFEAHRDTSESPDRKLERLVSVIIFLNSPSTTKIDYVGGDLIFYGLVDHPAFKKVGYPLQPETGLLIAFLSDMAHEVKPIIQGERFSVVTWFGYKSDPAG
ncbi:MAG: 2OG-Fe(II) oxygenase [Chloroflexota bacterium]